MAEAEHERHRLPKLFASEAAFKAIRDDLRTKLMALNILKTHTQNQFEFNLAIIQDILGVQLPGMDETIGDAPGARFHTSCPGGYFVISDHVGGGGLGTPSPISAAVRCR